MNVLVVDIGGSRVKLFESASRETASFKSGPHLGPDDLMRQARQFTSAWEYDVVSIGYPGATGPGGATQDPGKLGSGWVGYDFEQAFGRPVRVVNDAAMQALGGYDGGKLLFLGFGTGLGTAMIVDDVIVPMEIAHLPYRKKTFEDYVGQRALERSGVGKWRRRVDDVVRRLIAALQPEDVILGGGNARLIVEMPPRCRIGANSNAFPGGFRLWGQKAPVLPAAASEPTTATRGRPSRRAAGRARSKP